MILCDPRVVPGWSALYFPKHRTFLAALTTAFAILTLFLHEMAHLVAGRAVGVESRMGIGNRLWVLVAETDLSGLWSVPRRKRYLPFLAGAIFDTVVTSLLILVVGLHDFHWIVLSIGILKLTRAVIFTLLLRLLWQCFLFVRTDFYYVIATLFSCKNLMADAEDFLRNQTARLLHNVRVVDQSHIPEYEMRIIRSYSVVWIIGRLLAFSSLIFITIPLAIKYSRGLVATLAKGYMNSPYAYLDALWLTIFSLGTLIAGSYLWILGIFKRWRNPS